MKERYEIVKTLIRGKQSKRKTKTSSGIMVTSHKKPVGYVMKDLKTGKLEVLTYLESIEKVIKSGATNGQITVTKRSDGKEVPYIRSKAGYTALQDKEMVMEPLEYVDNNPNSKISFKMSRIIESYRERLKGQDKETKDTKEEYTKEELLGMVEDLRDK